MSQVIDGNEEVTIGPPGTVRAIDALLLCLLTAVEPRGSKRAANVRDRRRSTMLCSVAGWPSLSDGRSRVRSDGGMTSTMLAGLRALKPTCLLPPLRSTGR